MRITKRLTFMAIAIGALAGLAVGAFAPMYGGYGLFCFLGRTMWNISWYKSMGKKC